MAYTIDPKAKEIVRERLKLSASRPAADTPDGPATVIRETCALAGMPELATGFIAAKLSPREVLADLRQRQIRAGWRGVIQRLEGIQ